jgi:hypothetical protein
MKTIDKNVDMPENQEQEEIKNESAVDTSENTKDDAFDIWIEKHIGEKNLTDAYKFAIKWIRYAGQFKLKYIAYAVKYIVYAIGIILGTLLIYCVFAHIFDMMAGDTNSYKYTFFDNDLWATVISAFIAVSSFWAWDKGTKGFLYFIFLLAMVEYLDYSYLELSNTDFYVGKICFWLFFVIIPILLITYYSIYYSSDPKNNISEKEDVSVDSNCEKTANTSEI